MTFTFNELVLHFTGLVAIFSPVAAIAPYIGVAGHFSRKIQHKLAWRVALYSFLFLFIGSWSGVYILNFLGISIPALRAAGGIILLLSSLPMVMKGHSPRQKIVEKEDQENWKSVVVVPLVFPVTIGAASLSYVITLVHISSNLFDQLAVMIIILLDGIVIWLTYFFAGPLGRRLGSTGNDIMVRVGGIIVLALGITLLTGGLKELLPGLA